MRFVYGAFIALTGMGYGVFLTIFPATLADAYGFANFGCVALVWGLCGVCVGAVWVLCGCCVVVGG